MPGVSRVGAEICTVERADLAVPEELDVLRGTRPCLLSRQRDPNGSRVVIVAPPWRAAEDGPAVGSARAANSLSSGVYTEPSGSV